MRRALITGSSGLVGGELVRLLCGRGFKVFGLDNNQRHKFAGEGASTEIHRHGLDHALSSFLPLPVDVTDADEVEAAFRYYGPFDLVVHSAGQPAHEWATRFPLDDFKVNALGTLVMLEMFRRWCPEAVFIQLSSSRVYGSHIAELPLRELETRFDLPEDHPYYHGVDETIGLDQATRSLFGVSKASGDLAAQEYGRYFGLKVAVVRPVTVTGPTHQASASHGYLAHLVRCLVTGEEYVINGFNGKQVRDNLHVSDLAEALWHIYRDPRHTYGEVYNLGAGRASHNSILEVIDQVSAVTGRVPNVQYADTPRRADWRWCVFDTAKFRARYPDWTLTYDNDRLVGELCRHWMGAAPSQLAVPAGVG